MEVFSKKLTKTDVRKRLSIKSRVLKYFPKYKGGQNVQVLKVEDLDDGKQWHFRMIVRRKGRYQKPVLSGGWLAFVKSKKLEVGDDVQFLMEENLKYKIKVNKPVVLFKAIIGYSPTNHAAQ